jgi:hypothetical protein
VYPQVGGRRDCASSRRAVHAHWGTLDGLRDKRGRGHLDFARLESEGGDKPRPYGVLPEGGSDRRHLRTATPAR